MNKKQILEYIKLHLLEVILLTVLSTILLKDCGAHDLINDKVLPRLDSINNRLVQNDRKIEQINQNTSGMTLLVKKVTIDLGAIKEKYIHPEKQGIKCEVKQSKYINENEIGIYPDNEYKLVSGDRIIIMNTNSACVPSMRLTVTTGVKVEEGDSKEYFYLSKKMLNQLGIDTNKNKRGVYNLRFFTDQ